MLFDYSALLSTFNSDMILSNVYTYGRTISGLSGSTRCCIDTIENSFCGGAAPVDPLDGKHGDPSISTNEFPPPIFD
jgi:hypothetical protein